MSTTEYEQFRRKVESEGFDYTVREYGGRISDSKFQEARQRYLDASDEMARLAELEDYETI